MSRRIIIIEDEAIIAAELKSTLRLLGHQVVGHAMNGDKALDLFASIPADLVLLDINIKGTLTGIDLAWVIRKKYDVRFVFLTSFPDKGTLDEVKDTMPYGYIVKPFTEKDLKVNIELALHKHDAEVRERGGSKSYLEEKLHVQLTDREYALLQAFREGLTFRQAGERLFISIITVKTYQKWLFQLLGVSSRLQLLEKLR